MSRWRRLVRSAGGNAAVEFAIIVPVMLLLAAGIVETGLVFKVYNSTNRLATQYAIAWSDCSDRPTGTCLTELSNYTAPATVANFVPLLAPQEVTLQMFQVRMVNTTPTVVHAYPAGTALNAAQETAIRAILHSGQDGVVVTTHYRHTLRFFGRVAGPFLDGYLQPTYTIAQLKS